MRRTRKQVLPIKEAKTTLALWRDAELRLQFDDLGSTGLRDQLRDCLRPPTKARRKRSPRRSSNQFAVVARWDDVADRMIERYKGIASRR